MAISETKGSGVESYPYPVKEGQRYINLNPGRLLFRMTMSYTQIMTAEMCATKTLRTCLKEKSIS